MRKAYGGQGKKTSAVLWWERIKGREGVLGVVQLVGMEVLEAIKGQGEGPEASKKKQSGGRGVTRAKIGKDLRVRKEGKTNSKSPV